MELAVPEKSGDTFEGWYLTPDYSGEAVERISCTGTNLSLYAKWSNAVYSIRYELGGGILYESNPASVTAETECLLHEPVREGYLFLGWYDGAQGGTKYDRVGGGNAANVTLYALWQKSDALFSVLYDYMGGEATGKILSPSGSAKCTSCCLQARRDIPSSGGIRKKTAAANMFPAFTT